MSIVSYKVISHSVKETMALGKRVGRYLKAGDLVALVGVFGAGKTYFTKGLAQGLGVKRVNKVVSPSFVLCNVHKGKRLALYHFDVQRLANAKELLRFGLTEAFVDGVCVMEWADKWSGLMGLPNVLKVGFELKGKNKRLLEFSGKGKQWKKVIRQLEIFPEPTRVGI